MLFFCFCLSCYLAFVKAIHGFRETEKSHWNECNMEIMGRIQQLAFHKKDAIPATHVLDLAENGQVMFFWFNNSK